MRSSNNRFRPTCHPEAANEKCSKPLGEHLSGWTVAFPCRILAEYTDLEGREHFLPAVLAAIAEKLVPTVEQALKLRVVIKIRLLARQDQQPVELDIIAFREDRRSLKITCTVVHERKIFLVGQKPNGG